MSKNKTPQPVGIVGYGIGIVFGEYLYDLLLGKTLTIIESIGLKDTQEKAVKDLVRNMISDVMKEGIYIGGKTHTEIIKKHYEEKKSNKNQSPYGEIEIVD